MNIQDISSKCFYEYFFKIINLVFAIFLFSNFYKFTFFMMRHFNYKEIIVYDDMVNFNYLSYSFLRKNDRNIYTSSDD